MTAGYPRHVEISLLGERDESAQYSLKEQHAGEAEQSRQESRPPGFVRQCVGTGIHPARFGCRPRPSRSPHEVAPIQPQVHRHERDGPRQRRLMPGVRRHQSGPRQGTRGGGSHADENRAPDDGEAKPESIDESHRAALLEWLSVRPDVRASTAASHATATLFAGQGRASAERPRQRTHNPEEG